MRRHRWTILVAAALVATGTYVFARSGRGDESAGGIANISAGVLVADPTASDIVSEGDARRVLESARARGAETTIRYGPDTRFNVADLYRPTPESVPEAGSPVLVFFHGGGWLLGDRSQLDVTETTGPLVMMLDQGWTVVSAEYRLTSRSTAAPAQIRDARRLIKFLRSNAAEFGIDPDRVVVAGHSAGGQIALLAATSCSVGAGEVSCVQEYEPAGLSEEAARESSRPNAAVVLAPATDIAALTDEKRYPTLAFPAGALLGCSIDVTTCRSKALDLDPGRWLDASDPPVYLAFAVNDEVLAFDDHALPFAERADDAFGARGKFRFDVVEDSSHNLEEAVNASAVRDFLTTLVPARMAPRR